MCGHTKYVHRAQRLECEYNAHEQTHYDFLSGRQTRVKIPACRCLAYDKKPWWVKQETIDNFDWRAY